MLPADEDNERWAIGVPACVADDAVPPPVVSRSLSRCLDTLHSHLWRLAGGALQTYGLKICHGLTRATRGCRRSADGGQREGSGPSAAFPRCHCLQRLTGFPNPLSLSPTPGGMQRVWRNVTHPVDARLLAGELVLDDDQRAVFSSNPRLSMLSGCVSPADDSEARKKRPNSPQSIPHRCFKRSTV